GVDEMARPHSAIGRQEAFLLIKENLNTRACVISVRPNYFESRKEMIDRICDLPPFNLNDRSHRYRVASLCELRPVQVAQLVTSGLADEDEPIDAKRRIGELGRAGLATFLKDPLVLSLCIEMGTEPGFALSGDSSRVALVAKLLERLIHREWEKR